MDVVVRQASGDDDWARCVDIRRAVFIEEQGVSERDELDGLDDRCVHFLALDHAAAVGTARLWVTPEGQAKAQRVAVLARHRGRGIGGRLMSALEHAAATAGHREVILGAQLSAVSFYEGIGYVAYGPVFDDAGIDHRMMKKALALG